MADAAIDYENAKRILDNSDPASRKALAESPDVPPEILYFLVSDESPEVRRAVAANPATPRQADTMLAKDEDYGVRCELARKIVGTGLEGDERSQLWRMGFTILETLATDQVVRVRRALAEALKGVASAPRPIVTQLARDPDPKVASPILRNSPVLTDDDLVEIVEGDGPDWAKTAVAGRANVTPRVAEAIAAYGNAKTIGGMLKNKKADIPVATIDDLAERAKDVEAWHEPLVEHPKLSGKSVLRLARFVSGPLLSVLRGRENLEDDTKEKRDKIVEARGDTKSKKAGSKAAGTPGWSRGTPAERSVQSWEGAEDRVLRLHQASRLTEDAIELAMDGGDSDFVLAALAMRSGIPLPTVKRIFDMKSAKMITAICWKSGMKMRFALEVQKSIAQVQPADLVYARDGIDYPIDPEDMDATIKLFTG